MPVRTHGLEPAGGMGAAGAVVRVMWPWRRDRLPKIDAVKRIKIGPDDVVLIQVRGQIDQQQAFQMRLHIQRILRTDRIVVLGDGTQVSIAELPTEDA